VTIKKSNDFNDVEVPVPVVVASEATLVIVFVDDAAAGDDDDSLRRALVGGFHADAPTIRISDYTRWIK
jgi:hypothetical protein